MAQDTQQQSPRPSLSLGELLIEGKITEISEPKNSEFRFYNFQLKAKDEYSQPALIQISQPQAQRQFARENEVSRIKAAVRGYGRRNNGVLYVTNVLDFVEAV